MLILEFFTPDVARWEIYRADKKNKCKFIVCQRQKRKESKSLECPNEIGLRNISDGNNVGHVALHPHPVRRS